MTVSQLFDLSNDVAVVTGAGRGIGEGIARTLASAGAAVVCAARRTEEIERVCSSINSEGGRALAITTDVTDDHAVEALIDGATEAFGKLDILVNNAGGDAFEAPLVELPRVEFEKVMTLNATSLFICTAAAASRMNEGGRIINISSFAADTPLPGHGHYCAAKAAVSMLTRVYAVELSPHIRVNAIVPGLIPTETVANALGLEDKDLPNLIETWPNLAGRLGTPEDIGAAALYLASPASAWVTGEILRVSGGI